jgi:hypothetical protein
MGAPGSKDIEAREVLEEGQAQTGQIMSRATTAEDIEMELGNED